MIKPQGMSRDSGWLHHELLISLNHKVRFTVPFFSPVEAPWPRQTDVNLISIGENR